MKVQIENEVFMKIQELNEIAEEEVGGLLVVEEGEYPIITDILIPEQEVNSVHWDTKDTHGHAKLLGELAEKNPDIIPKLRGWWHKHPTSDWSADDLDTAKTMAKNSGFAISIFTNENNIKTRVDLSKPFEMEEDDVELQIIGDEKIKKWAKKEMKKVKPKKAKPINTNFKNTFGGKEKVSDYYEPWQVTLLPTDFYNIWLESNEGLSKNKKKKLAKRLYKEAMKEGRLLKKPVYFRESEREYINKKYWDEEQYWGGRYAG